MAITDPDEILVFRNVNNFFGEHFFIPDYQRGYRWESQQVIDLLNDLSFFHNEYPGESYSMQPIVVKRRENKWEVVDGQQRLTTVALILQALKHNQSFTIDYQVLENSTKYISDIADCPDIDDINLFHMKQAYGTVEDWVRKNVGGTFSFSTIEDLIYFCCHNLKFLWYRADMVDDSPGEKIFRRLNIGKIELTQSELIKALFLSKDNFANEAINRREELAHQWDAMEAALQNDEFWLFLNDLKDDKSPTRIEFILKYLYENYKDSLFVVDDKGEDINSRDALFRAYYKTFRSDRAKFNQLWIKAKDVISTWQLWYEDVTMYHLLGFLLFLFPNNFSLKELYDKWQSLIYDDFLYNYIAKFIKVNLIDKFNPKHEYITKDKNGKIKDHKREAFPYLLLMNVLYVLRQNTSHLNNPLYRQGVFYKFPFHLLKKEIKKPGDGWDVEHIDSATTNSLDQWKAQKEWILSSYLSLSEDKREELNRNENLSIFFNSGSDDESEETFKSLASTISRWIEPAGEKYPEKNRIYNFALLDSSTNRGYKNAIFPTKRQHIRNKTIGKLLYADWDKDKIIIKAEKKKSAFVPPCTLNVFTKHYSFMPGTFLRWTLSDALDYEKEINALFKWFKDNFNNE